MVIDFDKEKARESVLARHPRFGLSKREYDIEKNRQKRIAKRIDREKEIIELMFKNELSYKEIGEKYKVSRQRIHQILKEIYKRDDNRRKTK